MLSPLLEDQRATTESTMTIYLSRDGKQLDHIVDFVSYHQIAVDDITLWDSEKNGPQLPIEVSDCICILDHQLFLTFFKVDVFLSDLIRFCKNNNQIWVCGSHDCAKAFTHSKWHEQMMKLDREIPKHSLLLLLEADVSDRMYLNHLQCVRLLIYHNWHFGMAVRPTASSLDKTNVSHDYLLTMLRKAKRPHRELLWRELNSREGLLDRGLVSYRNAVKDTADTEWLGQLNTNQWRCGHASMDLYLDCWLEIVPETCYRDLYFFTEKTQKPIMTRTPFLVISTAGYLEWLRQQGFQTFHSLIDEGYDRHYRVEDRVRHMIDVLEHIVDNGAEEFYRASQPILDHNFSRLCEIAGARWYEFDRVMWQALETCDFDTNQPNAML